MKSLLATIPRLSYALFAAFLVAMAVRSILDQTRPLKLPQHLLNDINSAMATWDHDPKAPRWLNNLEDRMTNRANGMCQPLRKRPALSFGLCLSATRCTLMRCMLVFCAIFGLSTSVAALSAPAPILLDESNPLVQAWPTVTLLSDPQKKLGIKEVMEARDRFTTPETAYGTLGLRKDAVWLLIPISVSSQQQWPLGIDIDYPVLNRIDVYAHPRQEPSWNKPGWAACNPKIQRTHSQSLAFFRLEAESGRQLRFVPAHRKQGRPDIAHHAEQTLANFMPTRWGNKCCKACSPAWPVPAGVQPGAMAYPG